MNGRKDFIDTLQTTIRGLKEDGIITSEQLKEKIEVPIEWFYSDGVDRRILARTMDNICEKVNPNYKSSIKTSYLINAIKICESNGIVKIEVTGKDNWTRFYLSDSSLHHMGKIENFDSNEFIKEMQNTIIKQRKNRLKRKLGVLQNEDIQEILNIVYDQKQQENETKGLSISLSEMIENFGEYYRYLYNEKEQIKAKDIEVIPGGLIQQNIDQIPYAKTIENIEKEKNERVNEVYQFEERDNIFRQLNPIKIISFDSIDKDKQIQKGTYTSYIYPNKRENGGYFLLSEPYQGDKASRAVYVSDEHIETLNGGGKNPNFWVDIAREYLEMSSQEFHEEPSTYTFKHGTLDTYATRMKYIITGDIAPNATKGLIYSAKTNLSKLFGIEINKQSLKEIASRVTREDIDEARKMIMPQTQEKYLGGREE